MSLHAKIQTELKDAMRAKDAVRISVLRNMLAAFTNELVAKKSPAHEIDDESALSIIKRLVKQRKDSISQFTQGGRKDLAQNEEAELKILEVYLPKTMSREEILPLAKAKKENLNIADRSKIGALTGALMKDLKGKADGSDVKAVIDSLFQ